MIEWQSVVLEQGLQHLFDHRGRTPKKLGADFTSSGVQVISAKLVSGGRLNLRRERRFVSAEVYNRWMPVKLAEGDVLLTSEAPLGEAALVPANSTLCLGQRLFALRPDPEVLDPRFLYYWLRSAAGRSALEERSSGTTVLGIRQSELVQVEVPAPTIHLQRLIGALLAAIDELIENNRRRIELLEQMAQAVYREWFVHFRYPGHEDAVLVESPFGPIPEGWEVGTIGSVAGINIESRKPRTKETVRYLDISSLGDRSLATPAEISGEGAPGRARRVVRAGDIVWSMVRPARRAHALLVAPGEDWIASTGLAVLSATGISNALLFETVSAPEFSDHLVSHEGGSAYPAVKPGTFETAPILRPPVAVDCAFDDMAGPLHRLVWDLREASEQLAGIRDLLLPKLVTGQIDVSNLDLDALTESVA